MSVIRTYWALTVEESKPFVEVATAFNKGRATAVSELFELIECEEINLTTSGRVLLSYKERQDLPWLHKKPAFIEDGLYHYYTRAKTPQDKLVTETEAKLRKIPDFYEYCKNQFPNAEISIMGTSEQGRGFALYRTAFGVLKERLVMVFPIQTESPDYSKVPAGFVELSNSEYAELNKKVSTDDSTE